mmetsp:Transcript_33081/g.104682  ORF Transcript_33081/g.104682 Transcript_33081/m.104682 type:complete len:210 (+) Transcript_33081:546-1175(+)
MLVDHLGVDGAEARILVRAVRAEAEAPCLGRREWYRPPLLQQADDLEENLEALRRQDLLQHLDLLVREPVRPLHLALHKQISEGQAVARVRRRQTLEQDPDDEGRKGWPAVPNVDGAAVDVRNPLFEADQRLDQRHVHLVHKVRALNLELRMRQHVSNDADVAGGAKRVLVPRLVNGDVLWWRPRRQRNGAILLLENNASSFAHRAAHI